jgi:hypothetical protein
MWVAVLLCLDMDEGAAEGTPLDLLGREVNSRDAQAIESRLEFRE